MENLKLKNEILKMQKAKLDSATEEKDEYLIVFVNCSFQLNISFITKCIKIV